MHRTRGEELTLQRAKKRARRARLSAPEFLKLEAVADLPGKRARGNVVRARERGEEVVQRVLVGDVDGGKPQADLVLIAMEEVVLADGDVEEAARLAV